MGVTGAARYDRRDWSFRSARSAGHSRIDRLAGTGRANRSGWDARSCRSCRPHWCHRCARRNRIDGSTRASD
jgi:hypothetical protein